METATELVRLLMKCNLPLVCAHGRPTILHTTLPERHSPLHDLPFLFQTSRLKWSGKEKEKWNWRCLFLLTCGDSVNESMLKQTLDDSVTKKRANSQNGRLIHGVLRLRGNVEVEDNEKEYSHSENIHIKHELLVQILHCLFYCIRHAFEMDSYMKFRTASNSLRRISGLLNCRNARQNNQITVNSRLHADWISTDQLTSYI